MGYHRAGFDVVGVDIKPQPRYPFEFHQADAMTYPLDGFDAIHASPPCQRWSRATRMQGRPSDHPDMLTPTRMQLRASGIPFVIENVQGAPTTDHVMLCGEMFGLGVIRHRFFESNVLLLRPPHSKHRGLVRASARGDPSRVVYENVTGHETGVRFWPTAMGIDWMARANHSYEIAQAIPPAYTEFIGAQLIRAVSPP